MAQLDTVPCTACPPLPLCWLWQGSNEDAVGMWDKASVIGLDTQGSTELQRQDHPCN